MTTAFWLVLTGFAAACACLVWLSLGKWQARQRAEEARIASFLAGASGAASKEELANAAGTLPLPAAAIGPPQGNDLAQQKLLFEAAEKAGEAGEAALAIQLYARLLARYPASALTGHARAAAETQKKKLLKA